MNRFMAIILTSAVALLTAYNVMAITCIELDGSVVYSQESSPAYLGFFGNQYASESIMNQYGSHGSPYATYSVRNEYGSYGSPYAIYSANNPYTSTPPEIFKNGNFIGYLTTGFSSPGVSLGDIDSSCTFYSSVPANNPGGLPAPPASVDATDGTIVGGVSVDWTLVSTATSYNLYYSDYVDSTQHFIGEYTEPPASLTGGSAGVVAYFWVYSVNASGESVSGSYDTGYPKADDSTPADLTITILDAANGTYKAGDILRVDNKVENIGGAASENYRLTFFASTDMTISESDFNLGYTDRDPLGVSENHYYYNNITLPDSLPDGSYYIGGRLTVSDSNSDNNSKYDSTPITMTSVSVTVPDAPTLITVDPGDEAAELHFTANGDGGSAITGFTANCAAFSQTGTSSPITVSGLRNGLTYSCSVVATNAIGDSAPSASLSVTPEATGSSLKVSDNNFSGLWGDPDQSGHGFNVITLDDTVTVIFWYVYHTDRTPMFLITVGINDGNRTEGTTYYNTGMKFGEFDPNDIVETVWGTSSMTFHSCNSATIEYSSNDPEYGSGTLPVEFSAPISGNKCTDSPLHGNYNGNWADSDGVGYGLAALFENGDMIFYTQSDSTAGVGLGIWSLIGEGQFSYEATFSSVSGSSEYVSGTGTFNEDELSATYSGGGELFATPMPGFQHGLDTAKLAGDYDIYDLSDTIIGSATIQSDGKITGTTNLGCTIDGTFAVPNTNFNQAYLNASLSNCSNAGSGSGAAVYRNSVNEIVIASADGWYGYVWTLKLK